MRLTQKLELIRDALRVIAAAHKNKVEPETIAFVICDENNKSEIGLKADTAEEISKLDRAIIRAYAATKNMPFDDAVLELIKSEEERTNASSEHNGQD